MTIQPLVSIIIPAFNAQDMIAETLDSILAQTYMNLEIIVIDDGSTDQTRQVVQRYEPKVSYYYQENSGGCAVPRNTGISYSNGDYLCFMDADDLMMPDRIMQQVDFMERYSDVGLVFCDYRNFDERGCYADSHFKTCPKLWFKLHNQQDLILDNPCSYLVQENYGIAGSFMIRKAVLKFAPSFDPTLKACEDFHFYYRLARHVPVGVINKVGMLRRLHANNMSGNPKKMLAAGIKSRALLKETENSFHIIAQLDRYIANCHSSLARYFADHNQYMDALQQDWQGLYKDLCWKRLQIAARGIGRTLLLALGAREIQRWMAK